MPIYEYSCPKCGHFELVQKISDKPVLAKPDCGEKSCPRAATRLISASAFHLKGSGWYKTDYSGGSKSTTSDGGSKQADSGDKGDKKDSKPETAKNETKPKKCGSGCGCH